MSRSPEMEASEGLLVDYVLGQLDRDEARALEQRIAAEPEVAREVERLRALPAGQVYRLWALVGEKNVPCGDFGVNPEGRVVTQFPIPVDSYTAPIAKLFLTVEPTSAGPEPSGPTVMTS